MERIVHKYSKEKVAREHSGKEQKNCFFNIKWFSEFKAAKTLFSSSTGLNFAWTSSETQKLCCEKVYKKQVLICNSTWSECSFLMQKLFHGRRNMNEEDISLCNFLMKKSRVFFSTFSFNEDFLEEAKKWSDYSTIANITKNF